jgi:hypothetical protein
MNDPLSKTLEEIRKEAEKSGVRIFNGALAEDNNVPTVYWSRENGGDWDMFFACAKTLNASILYVSWDSFEQSEIDDAVSKLESEITEDHEEDRDTSNLLNEVRAFQPKVGLTRVIELVFVANGMVHYYQETADWSDEFDELISDEAGENGKRKTASKAVVNKWAKALASDLKYSTIKQHEYLLEKLTGKEFPKLPVNEILRRAEMIFQVDFKQVAEEKLANEIQELRNQGFNMHAISMKLGISNERVSGLLSLMTPKKKSPA